MKVSELDKLTPVQVDALKAYLRTPVGASPETKEAWRLLRRRFPADLDLGVFASVAVRAGWECHDDRRPKAPVSRGADASRNQLVPVRCSPAELQAWTQAAKAQGRTLQDVARGLLDAWSGRGRSQPE